MGKTGSDAVEPPGGLVVIIEGNEEVRRVRKEVGGPEDEDGDLEDVNHDQDHGEVDQPGGTQGGDELGSVVAGPGEDYLMAEAVGQEGEVNGHNPEHGNAVIYDHGILGEEGHDGPGKDGDEEGEGADDDQVDQGPHLGDQLGLLDPVLTQCGPDQGGPRHGQAEDGHEGKAVELAVDPGQSDGCGPIDRHKLDHGGVEELADKELDAGGDSNEKEFFIDGLVQAEEAGDGDPDLPAACRQDGEAVDEGGGGSQDGGPCGAQDAQTGPRDAQEGDGIKHEDRVQDEVEDGGNQHDLHGGDGILGAAEDGVHRIEGEEDRDKKDPDVAVGQGFRDDLGIIGIKLHDGADENQQEGHGDKGKDDLEGDGLLGDPLGGFLIPPPIVLGNQGDGGITRHLIEDGEEHINSRENGDPGEGFRGNLSHPGHVDNIIEGFQTEGDHGGIGEGPKFFGNFFLLRG